MHSFDAPDGTTFHHNSDYSGNVTVSHTNEAHNSLSIPMADIAAFYLEYIRKAKIAKIELMTPNELEQEFFRD